MNALSTELINQYLESDYLLKTESQTFVLNIGKRPTQEFVDFLASIATDRWAIITAWNPYSRALTMSQNHKRQLQLEKSLGARGHTFYPAVGQSADGKWQETSVWVPGISRHQAKQFGVQFQQNAVVYGEFPGTVYLIICSDS